MAELLLAGPRGRRFLLHYALISEGAASPAQSEALFSQATVQTALRLDPHISDDTAVRSRARFGWVDSLPEVQHVSAFEVAQRLGAVELLDPTPERLRTALKAAVDTARYWQEPDGEDRLAATPEMRHALQHVARHVAASPHLAWWRAPVDRSTQHCVLWEGTPPWDIPEDIHATIRAARDRELAQEQLARTHRDPDPAANWSGEWWSQPPKAIPSSTRTLFDGSPAGLWFVEDSLGWEQAQSTRFLVPDDVSVFEITQAADWAELCARFPLDVTAQKRHEWYRTTDRIGRWVIPDWAQVARHYDGVHLHVAAYLSAAGTAIPVAHSMSTASVIAGWNPDETYWFSTDIVYDSECTQWVFGNEETNMVWTPTST